MIRIILTWLAVLAAVAALVGLVVGSYERWAAKKTQAGYIAGAQVERTKWDEERLKLSAAAAQAAAQARAQEQETAALARKGERHAQEREAIRNAAALAAAGRSGAAAAGLQGDLTALDAAARAADLPSAASCPAAFDAQRTAATRARAALGACSAEYTALAADADRAEGALQLRLDTALSYIAAVTRAIP